MSQNTELPAFPTPEKIEVGAIITLSSSIGTISVQVNYILNTANTPVYCCTIVDPNNPNAEGNSLNSYGSDI